MGPRILKKNQIRQHQGSKIYRPKNQGLRRIHKKRYGHQNCWKGKRIMSRKKPIRSSKARRPQALYTHHSIIDNLDDACLLNIFKYLPTTELLILRLTCQRWCSLIELMLGKNLSTFNINDEYYWCPKSVNMIDFQRCKQIFVASRPLVTKMNLSLSEKLVSLLSSSVSFVSLCRCPLKFPINCQSLNQFPLCCSRITELIMCKCIVNITDDYLTRLFKNNQNIQYLSLTGFKLSGSCLSSLSQKSLHTIILSNCEFANLDLSFLCRKFQKLHTLSLKDTQVSQENNFDCDEMNPSFIRFHEISNLSLLKILILSSSSIDDSDLYHIASQCTELVVLDIAFCFNIFNVSFQKVNCLPKLKCLNISGIPNLFDEDLLLLSRNLKTLDISNHVNFTEQGLLKMLSRLPYIEKVEMAHCSNISDHFVNTLTDLCDSRLDDVILEIGCFGTEVEIVPDESLFLTVILNDSLEIDYSDYA